MMWNGFSRLVFGISGNIQHALKAAIFQILFNEPFCLRFTRLEIPFECVVDDFHVFTLSRSSGSASQ